MLVRQCDNHVLLYFFVQSTNVDELKCQYADNVDFDREYNVSQRAFGRFDHALEEDSVSCSTGDNEERWREDSSTEVGESMRHQP